MVVLIKKQVEVAKECSEVFDALAGLVADVKSGKPVAEIVAGNFQSMLIAVQGFEALNEEIKSAQVGMTVGVGLGQIATALLTPAIEA